MALLMIEKFQWKNWLISFLFIFLVLSKPILGDQFYINHQNDVIRIEVVRSSQDLDLEASKDILVRSFMRAYEDVPLIELSPNFKSIGDVKRFYQDYFAEELHHFEQGNLYWTRAFVNGKLAGWATFEIEKNESNAAYMNLLVVAPEYQKKGVGSHLVFSIRSNELFPNIHTINLLIRKINISAYLFYQKLGFVDSNYQRDNFVDPALLTGLTWSQ